MMGRNFKTGDFIAYLYANGNTWWGKKKPKTLAERQSWKAGLGRDEGGFGF